MKIQIKDNFITDNTDEIRPNCYFLQTTANKKYIKNIKDNNFHIIDAAKCIEILDINKDIKIIGICGTNGKTTTSMAIYETLLRLGYNAFLCGTSGAFMNNERVDNKGLTTNSIIKTLSFLQIATKNKCEYFIMEVSSHAIDQNRIEGLNFYLKIFTNLSQDHLDYHKTMQNYINTKSSFFLDDGLKLINKDDKLINFNQNNAKFYSLNEICDFYSLKYTTSPKIDAVINDEKFSSNLIGKFNLYNLLCAFSALSLITNHTNKDILMALKEFGGAKGRVEIVSKKPLIIVDFAHTPDGIEKILSSIEGDKIVIFGAGGNRDKTKRPLMGSVVQKFAKFFIITSDNPRDEKPKDIIDDILSGINDKNFIIEEDRELAIKKGIDMLSGNEILLILGKGDEDYQEINGEKFHFSDKEVVMKYLNSKG